MATQRLPLYYDVKFIVLRNSSEEATFGIVKAEVNNKRLLKEGNFLEALKKAVTRWIRTYETGAARWRESCEDFNLGDLSCQDVYFCRDTDQGSDLGKELAKVGIFSLRIEVICNDSACQFWTYDTVLCEEGKK